MLHCLVMHYFVSPLFSFPSFYLKNTFFFSFFSSCSLSFTIYICVYPAYSCTEPLSIIILSNIILSP
eukprot:UN02376